MQGFFQRLTGDGRAALTLVLPLGIAAAILTRVLWPAPPTVVSTAVSRPPAMPSPVPTVLAQFTDTPAPTASITPTPTLTLIPFVYQIAEVPLTEVAGGTKRLFIIDHEGPILLPGIHPANLQLPNPNVRPQTGRFMEPRGIKYPTLHLGSDYKVDGDDILTPPHEDAILVAVVYLKRGEYNAVAVDMSGDIQMYWVNLTAGNHIGEYIICYAHLRDGSNEEALREAQANNGRVETMGLISTVGDGNGSLSDLHIAVIDVEVLYGFTGAQDIETALHVLFSGTLPRMGQQYPQIFVEPESIFPALANNLEDHTQQK